MELEDSTVSRVKLTITGLKSNRVTSRSTGTYWLLAFWTCGLIRNFHELHSGNLVWFLLTESHFFGCSGFVCVLLWGCSNFVCSFATVDDQKFAAYLNCVSLAGHEKSPVFTFSGCVDRMDSTLHFDFCSLNRNTVFVGHHTFDSFKVKQQFCVCVSISSFTPHKESEKDCWPKLDSQVRLGILIPSDNTKVRKEEKNTINWWMNSPI